MTNKELLQLINDVAKEKMNTLFLGFKQLSTLPAKIGKLSNLSTLYLNGNQLSKLPAEIGKLSNLTTIDLAGNQLSTLPAEIGKLSNLTTLYLNGNQLSKLPAEIGKLSNLITLNLSGNQLSTLPRKIGQLSNLRALNLNDNQLSTLPAEIGQLSNLKELNLNDNQLNSLPAEIGQLSNLREFNLSDNQLSTLPAEIGQLSNLKELNLNDNQLNSLPAEIGQLSNLKLVLENNPLNPEIAAAYREGSDILRQYLQTKADAQIELNEAKLVFIGEGGVGKSSLLAALRGDPWVEKRDTTHGIEVKQLTVFGPESGKEITMNGWDFGGQPTYRPTHQLFFTAPAVYLVVWDPRRGPDQSCVDEWIKMVKHRAYDEKRHDERPRMLVVASHGGPKERRDHIDEQALREQFGDLIETFHHIDSHTGAGLERLKEAIFYTANDTAYVDRLVPKSWKQILDTLNERSEAEPYIRYKEFEALCREHQINEKKAILYAVILNELGYLIYYKNDPILDDTVILKPDWLSKAISFVLEDPQVKSQNGLVRHDRLSEIWEDPLRPQYERYPSKIHPVFIRLMEKFDLSYRVVLPSNDDNGFTSLVSQLVPGKRPENLAQAWPAGPQPGDTQRTQICLIVDAEDGRPAYAHGLLYRLIVRLHPYSLGHEDYTQSCHWQKGMVLNDRYNGSALIEQIGGDIRISVRAAYPERLLHHLCQEVKWLVNAFWKGLQCRICVPCKSQCKGLFEIDELIETRQEGIPKIRCSVCKTFQQIDPLIATVAPMPERQIALAELKRGQAEIKQAIQTGFQSTSVQLRTLLSQVDEQFLALINTLTDEAKDGPRLFSFEPLDPGFFDKPKWISEKFRLTLWCEHSRLPLSVLCKNNGSNGRYEIELTRQWLKKTAPFIKTMVNTLDLILPIAASATKLLLDDTAIKSIEKELDFNQKCMDAIIKGGKKISDWLNQGDSADLRPGTAIRAHGLVLHELHALLKKKDPSFGGLVRVQNKRREFLWVHPQFENEYY